MQQSSNRVPSPQLQRELFALAIGTSLLMLSGTLFWTLTGNGRNLDKSRHHTHTWQWIIIMLMGALIVTLVHETIRHYGLTAKTKSGLLFLYVCSGVCGAAAFLSMLITLWGVGWGIITVVLIVITSTMCWMRYGHPQN